MMLNEIRLDPNYIDIIETTLVLTARNKHI